MSEQTSRADLLELPDDLRMPLHGLQADAGYLIGRVAADGSTSGAILQSLETRLSQVAAAAYRLNGERADLLSALKELLAALREIVKGAPTEDPGEGCWDSMADAWDAGVAAQAWDTAQIARAAISKAEGR